MKLTLQQLIVLVVVALCPLPAAGQRTQMVHIYNATPEDLRTPTVREYFTVTLAAEEDVEAFRQQLLAAGARNVNWFSPDVVACDLPSSRDVWSLVTAPGIVRRTVSEVASATAVSDPLAQARRAYEMAEAMRLGSGVPGSMAPPADDFRDVVFEASPERVRQIQTRMESMQLSTSAGPGDIQKAVNQNSEILTGSIKVYMLLPESNGAIDAKSETWKNPDGTKNQDYVDARTNAFAVLLDWQGRFPNMGISFTFFDVLVDCDYEPIYHNSSDDEKWILNVLRRLEPDVVGVDDALGACAVFNEKRRGGYDWIFTSFIGHSRNEPDHRFRNANYTAYAWLGGPYQVTPYPAGTDPNNIGENLVFSKIYQHESSHVFWTLDEYPNAPGNCASTSGYLNYSNQNINMIGPNGIDRCTIEVDCIMDQAAREDVGRPYCKWSLGHLAVIDNNNNTIPDAFEAPPIISFATSDRDTVETDEYTVRLSVLSQAVPNQNRAWDPETRVNYAAPLREAQFSVGGGWLSLPAKDGRWDGILEETSVAVQSLPPGLTEMRFRARNEVGLWSNIYTVKVYYIGVNYTGLGARPGDGHIEVRWEVVGEAFGALFDVYRVAAGEVIPDLRFLDKDAPLPGELLAESVPPVGTVNGFTTYRHVDRNVSPGVKYRYYVNGRGEVQTADGVQPFRSPSHVVGETAMVPVPAGSIISHASPNPFRSEIKFSLSVPRTVVQVTTGAGSQAGSFGQRTPTRVEVSIYDVLGRRVKSLINRDELRDVLTLSWDGTDERNGPAPSGVYFIRAKAGTETAVEKALLIR